MARDRTQRAVEEGAGPDWQSLDLFAPTPEHALLAETLREFVEREVEGQAAEHDRDERFNHALFRRAGELGLLGVTVPEAHGGAGMDAIAAVQVFEALSTSDPGFGLAVLAHAILFTQNLAVNGNDEQRGRVLPKATSGEWIGGLCMTEPEVGTDVLAMRTRAVREGEVYRLSGTKTFITNGGIDEETLGDVFIVYATTGEREISSFLVEKGMEGFQLGQKWSDKLGMRASFTAELVFDGVPVPFANRLGEEGEGTLHMMRNLEIERLTLAAQALGIAQRCLAVMIDYANERKAFGRPIRDFGQIQRYIAETFAEYRAARSYVYDTARRLSLSATGQRVDADATKLFAAQVGKRAADAAIQVLGGNGYMGEYVVQRLWRDAKLLEIGGGTLEAHHKNLSKDLCRDPSIIG
ncbi:MAG: acyl-CoA dehydrogenase family protein [Deltaproteobacteria bacterium]|nr:acyl-CoA dehydrogenase family protein [Deltaproteobacteria bacterium]MBW2417329.1 acyl-CoA dehydrogenase family protein [Deltaproteobacteria bacterium]